MQTIPNEPYAIAKMAGIKLCNEYNGEQGTRFVSVKPTNLYGPNDTTTWPPAMFCLR